MMTNAAEQRGTGEVADAMRRAIHGCLDHAGYCPHEEGCGCGCLACRVFRRDRDRVAELEAALRTMRALADEMTRHPRTSEESRMAFNALRDRADAALYQREKNSSRSDEQRRVNALPNDQLVLADEPESGRSPT